MKIVKHDDDNSLVMTADGDSDKLLLSVIAKTVEELSVVTEMCDRKVIAADYRVKDAIANIALCEELNVLPLNRFGRLICWLTTKKGVR